MPRVVLTGGPGAGKTALLAELSARGYPVVTESARQIIQERNARGQSPRPNPAKFAREILDRDIAKYKAHPESSQCIFFDRSVVESIGMVHEVSPLPPSELQSLLAAHRVHAVFALPPWEAIYVTDRERDQSFAEAVAVYAKVVHWYAQCGYATHKVPLLSVAQRAEYVLSLLAQRAA